jgi:hypothetical protein
VRHRLTAVVILALLVAAGCGGGSDRAPTAAPRATTTTAAAAPSSAAAPAAAAPRCRRVPAGTVRLIASHGNPKTRFAAGAASAVRVRSGYAVSLVAIAGGSRRMATWFVDELRAPRTVTSGNLQALQVTNWPLESLGAEPVRQSQLCTVRALRGAGPVAP